MSATAHQQLLIDGKLVDPAVARTFDNINPATEEVIGQVPDAGSADVDAAIDAARRAFDRSSWSTDHELRQRSLLQLHDALAEEREAFRAELISEVGCPVLLTYGPQLDAPLGDAIRWPAEQISSFEWERDEGLNDSLGTRAHHVVVREPVGVVAAITPWNFPFEVELNKLGQALATGNTVVLKPAPDTPAHALRLARIIAEKTDIPPGVVNVVTPSDHALGEVMVTDPRVDLVSFTGSTRVGQRIVEQSASTFKRLFLELGGKSAHVVLDDADFASVVPGAAAVAAHAGQGCGMLTRLLLPRSRYDEGVELAAAGFGGMKVGDPTDPTVICGPVINARQRDRIRGYIERGVADGGRLVVGGAAAPEGLDRGFFVQPTLFADIDNSMAIAQEEIFGPVLVAIPYDDDDQAVAIANDSPYGLAGAVSGSPERAEAIARRIRAGSMSVNGAMYYGPHMPFGGYKTSGIGRQNGIEGFLQYLETKSLATPAT